MRFRTVARRACGMQADYRSDVLVALLCSAHGLTPLSGVRHAPSRRMPPARCNEEPPDETLGTGGLDEAFASELSQRGLLTSLQAIEADGPSAFKDPRTIVEYGMLCLQHRGPKGVAEAFRFTMPPAAAASATHGTRQVARRISWLAGRVIEGSATGRTRRQLRKSV